MDEYALRFCCLAAVGGGLAGVWLYHNGLLYGYQSKLFKNYDLSILHNQKSPVLRHFLNLPRIGLIGKFLKSRINTGFLPKTRLK